MTEPPNYLDGAKVIKWAWSGPEPFGIIEILDSDEKEEIFGLTICKYDDSDNFYRFSCNKNWEVVQDSFYNSIEEAIAFLPEQYKKCRKKLADKIKTLGQNTLQQAESKAPFRGLTL